jgi:signal transduction histidine kinase
VAIRDDVSMDLLTTRDPVRARIAWAVCVVDWALLVAALVLGLQTLFVIPFVGFPLAAGIAAWIGAAVISRAPRNRSGWLLVMFATAAALNVVLFQVALFLTERGLGGLSLSRAVIAAGLVAFYGITLTLPLLLLTFPDGRLPSRRWRSVVALLIALGAVGAGVAVGVTGNIFDPAAFVVSLEVARAEGVVVPGWAAVVFVVGDALLLVVFAACAASLVVRQRRARGEERQQIKWVVYAGAVALLLFPVDLVRSSSAVVWSVQQVLASAGALMLPVGFGIALLRYRLWDVDVVIRRSVVYGFLWLTITGCYLAVAAGLGLVAGASFPVEVAIGLTVLTTLVFLPARRRMEQAADRWVFGRTTTPVEAVQDLGEVLDTTDRPGQIATQLARTAAGAAGLAWVEVDLDQAASVEVGARHSATPVVMPIRRGDEEFGSMACLPHRGRRLSEDDLELLEALAAQAGLALAHVRLASRIVHAQETERRRIEQDIHDGAQQELATLVALLGLARAQTNGDASTQRILAEVQQEVHRILGNLRELTQGIHPSVLRDGGIAAVVRDRCSRLPIRVGLEIDPRLQTRRFADDIEGAAYFFFSEALANVLKHSRSDPDFAADR